ncbi:SDR family NAD(P)-dependent oxidoreductase [Streptomyces fulvoviolaceus]|uniref:SDR family NAD(P)-dependent oxidoreductase n=1 Tax=Streptomyces fulvoviolaceus TaxID=285535 RepID=UPI0004CC0B27|nr:SDR family oxidoreductase [Streptomyces fulvoviolaceus]MCT9083695.1 SDR family oxidoreductase [Streptomyces fulvoviolaceus]
MAGIPRPLEGKVAVVTGGSRGIGAAVATRFAAEGASVVVGYRNAADSAQELVTRLKAQGTECLAVRADVAEPADVEALLDRTVNTFGALHVLASCAGIEHFGALPALTPEAVDRVFAVNTRGQLLAARCAAPHLTDGGRIILTSSVAARRTVHEHTLYAASKAAVEAMVRCLSVELGRRGVTINAVAPGATATDMAAENGAHYQPPDLELPTSRWLTVSHALGRIATAEEVAGAYAFLAGPDAAYVTGRTLPVDNCVF